jgi:hypothetical protein
MRFRSVSVSLLCVGVIAFVLPPSARASRGSSFGESPVIVWDGEKDVVVSQGEGQSQTLADRHLANLADFAVRAVGRAQFSGDPLTPTSMNFVRLLLWPDGLVNVCAAAAKPSLCARMRTLQDAMGGATRFTSKFFRTTTDTTRIEGDPLTTLAALPTISFDLVPAEKPGYWRLAAADRSAVAEIIAFFGASAVHVGYDSEKPVQEDGRRDEISDANLPVPTAYQAATSGGPFDPAISCLAIDPVTPANLYVCASPAAPPDVSADWSANSEQGLFRSTNGGQTWTRANGLSGAVRSIAVDPRNPATVYAAAGVDLYKSTDRGVTWTSIRQRTSFGAQEQANVVAVDPATSAVLVAFDFTLDRSTNGGTSWTLLNDTFLPPWPHSVIRSINLVPTAGATRIYVDFDPLAAQGVLRSLDNGATWSLVPTPSPQPPPMLLAAVDPSTPGVLYARYQGTIYRTANDGGVWQATMLGEPLMLDATLPQSAFSVQFGGGIRKSDTSGSAAAQVLAAAGAVNLLQATPSGSLLVAAYTLGIFKSTDHGVTWTADSGPLAATVSILQIGANGSLIASHVSAPSAQSTDGGRSWTTFAHPPGTPARTIVVNPRNRTQLLMLSHFGLAMYRSDNNGTTWTQLSVPAPSPGFLLIEHVAFDPTVDGRIVAVIDGNIAVSGDSGATWTYRAPSFVFTSAPVFTNAPGEFFLFGEGPDQPAGEVHTQVVINVFGLWKTTDAGVTWTNVSPSDPSEPLVQAAQSLNPLLAFEPVRSTLLYAQSGFILRSKDRGVTWTSVVLSHATQFEPAKSLAAISDGEITALAVGAEVTVGATTTAAPFIAGTDHGIYVSTDDGLSWAYVLRLRPAGLPTTRVTAIAAKLNATNGQVIFFGTDAGVWQFEPAATPPTSISVDPAGGYVELAVVGGANAAVTITNAPWISRVTSQATITGDGTVVLRIAPNASSQRSGTLQIMGQTFIVTQPSLFPPTLTPTKTSLRFAAVTSGAAFVSKTSAQEVTLLQGGSSAQWSATATPTWLTVSPAASAGGGTMMVGVQFVQGLPLAGTVTGTVTVRDSVTQAALATIAVSMDLVGNGTSPAPFGAVDTPVDPPQGTPLNQWPKVSGSLAVTGWALDDVEVTRVRILRDPVGAEAPGQQVYIGNATFVDGARPDVAGNAVPRNTRGGWGYLMLTNFLPNGGNGYVTLYAYADDAQGNSKLLGTRLIRCDNANAIEPFGAIDTPEQGATVSGIIMNFGWVLSPNPRRADPPGGGTVTVLIDGVAVGSPGGWAARPDITGLFPAASYTGVTRAVAGYPLDTTTLTNGSHTIAWIVTDNQGATQGVGSRFFTVANGSAAPSLVAQSIGQVRTAFSAPVSGRLGDLDSPLQTFAPGADGIVMVRIQELERIELHIAPGAMGAMRSRDGAALALPAGSHLDSASGVFTWQPAAGFIGPYDFTFMSSAGQTELRIVIRPQGSRAAPQVVIDAPIASSEVDRAFLVGGWALDPSAATGSGIDAIHVWAYPRDGSAPLFAGAATLGGRRPDVSALYGEHFDAAGYGLIVRDLPQGDYTLAVFARRASTGEFLPARLVNVTIR